MPGKRVWGYEKDKETLNYIHSVGLTVLGKKMRMTARRKTKKVQDNENIIILRQEERNQLNGRN